LNINIGGDTTGIIYSIFGAYEKVKINVKLGKLIGEEIGDTNFVNALKKRYHTIKYF
jgi:hypothetical protein